MALTIAIEGKGVIANADAETDDTGGTGTGDWGWNGSGGVAWGLTTDTFLYGVSCISAALSGAKAGFLYFDRGVGNELDFDIAGAEENQLIYIWVHCPTIGLIETLANEGLNIIVATDLSNYRVYTIAGNDGANGWDGGWKCFVIDPTKDGSVTDVGTYDFGSVRYIGCYMETTGTAKGDNLFIDQIAVGRGLSITGTSTTGWKDVNDYCIDYPNRAWGMMQEREGIYYAYGRLKVGSSVQGASVSFADDSRIIKFGDCEYWNGSAWVTSIPDGFSGLVVDDAGGFTTTFEDGILVGTDKGRAGSLFIGSLLHDCSIDLYGGNNAGSLTKLYNTAFRDMLGGIVWGNDADHLFYGGVINNCGQFDPVGAPKLRNLTISGYTLDADGALLWNENIDIKDCNFLANTGANASGIEHPSAVGSPYSYDNLRFAGNDYDVNNTSGSAIVIDCSNLADPGTYKGSAVTFLNAILLKVWVFDEAGDPVFEAQVAIYKVSDDSPLMNEDTLGSGLAEQSYNYAGDVDIYIRVRKSSTGATKYLPFYGTGTIISTGFTLTIRFIEDKIVA